MTQVSLDKLSKKNQEFVRIATHQLIKDGKTDEEIKTLLMKILPTILENQAKGITARGLYGAPTVWAANFSETKQKEAQTVQENTNPYLMIMDAFLFVFSLFAILNSSVNLFSKNPSNYGVVTIVLGSAVGALVFYGLYYFIYRFYYADQDQSQKPPFFKSLLIISAATILWAVVLYGTTFLLPAVLNPKLPNLFILVFGGVTMSLRFSLKKKFDIRSALTAPRQL